MLGKKCDDNDERDQAQSIHPPSSTLLHLESHRDQSLVQ